MLVRASCSGGRRTSRIIDLGFWDLHAVDFWGCWAVHGELQQTFGLGDFTKDDSTRAVFSSSGLE